MNVPTPLKLQCRVLPKKSRAMTALPALCFILLFACQFAWAGEFPTSDQIAKKLLARARRTAESDAAPQYTYEKHSLVEEMDDHQRVTKSTEKVYRVLLVRGMPFTRLVKIQGRNLTETELAKEDQREAAFRKRIDGVDLKKKAAKREAMITPELVERFDFKVLRREVIRSRPALVISFTPKSSASDKTIQDKILSRVAGTLWIDEEEFEVTKLQSGLRSTLSLGWFGFVGSLTRCDLTLERERMPDGVWINVKNNLLIVARKLFDSMHYRTTEVCSGFHKQ